MQLGRRAGRECSGVKLKTRAITLFGEGRQSGTIPGRRRSALVCTARVIAAQGQAGTRGESSQSRVGGGVFCAKLRRRT